MSKRKILALLLMLGVVAYGVDYSMNKPSIDTPQPVDTHTSFSLDKQ